MNHEPSTMNQAEKYSKAAAIHAARLRARRARTVRARCMRLLSSFRHLLRRLRHG